MKKYHSATRWIFTSSTSSSDFVNKIKSVQTPGSVTSRLDAEMNYILTHLHVKMNVESGRFTVKFYSVIFILKKLKQAVKKKKVKKKYKQVSKNFLKNEVIRWRRMRRRMRTCTSSIVCQKSAEKKLRVFSGVCELVGE